MSFWKIAWRNMQQRAVASSLTGLSMALGVAVMIAVLVINKVAVKQFSQDAQGYHLIVGAKGGKLQLVLNTVFHLSQPIENVHYYFYEEFLEGGRFADFTKVAVPFCLGDSYAANGKRFRVAGTTPDMFEKLSYGRNADGTEKRYTFQEGGRNFRHENPFEAVIGSVVASQTGLKVNDQFNPTHGIPTGDDGQIHKERRFTVVGILSPTGTANDRALFINMEGFYLLENHAMTEEQAAERIRALDIDRGSTTVDLAIKVAIAQLKRFLFAMRRSGEQGQENNAANTPNVAEHPDQPQPLPHRLREVTAILVLAGAPDMGTGESSFDELIAENLKNIINEGTIAQAVSPAQEVANLLERIVGPIHLVLLVLTVLIVVVASISILVSIYNSMHERSHDIAVMRALGASRTAVMTIVLTESILLSLCGGGAGILLGHGLIGAASPLVESRTGVALGFFEFDQIELILIPSLVLLASIVGLLPAAAAYRTDVAKGLGGSR